MREGMTGSPSPGARCLVPSEADIQLTVAFPPNRSSKQRHLGVGGEKDVFPLLVKDCVQLQETPEITKNPPRENLFPSPVGPEGRAGVAARGARRTCSALAGGSDTRATLSLPEGRGRQKSREDLVHPLKEPAALESAPLPASGWLEWCQVPGRCSSQAPVA